jgi:phosphoribosyl 1,2-cyclic phosphodiesterase
MRFASLGSGSAGNGLVVEVDATRVLLDCGFGIADTTARLARLGLVPEQLSGIVVTHEHEDHIGGVARLARRYQLPVWLTYGTYKGLEVLLSKVPTLHFIDNYQPFLIDSIEVTPYPVPHDAREPAQFVFGDGVRRLGVLTDTGASTRHMEQVLSGVNGLVLECNHDRDMLRDGHYPQRLKDRVGGRLGHLDNEAAAGLASRLDLSRLQHLVAAHLSQHNNRPQLARAALATAIDWDASSIVVADQQLGSPWLELQ